MYQYIQAFYCSFVQTFFTQHSFSLRSGALHVGSQYFGEEVLPVTIGGVSCNGTEARLLDCSYSTDVTCQTERNDAGVVCQGIL